MKHKNIINLLITIIHIFLNQPNSLTDFTPILTIIINYIFPTIKKYIFPTIKDILNNLMTNYLSEKFKQKYKPKHTIRTKLNPQK